MIINFEKCSNDLIADLKTVFNINNDDIKSITKERLTVKAKSLNIGIQAYHCTKIYTII